ncbi:MAG: hypothetical protein M5R36_11200 [Deltaproteobacteria bacterium]|nr:hypothetical protein [Deltaproteobacteria bacterium]
MRLTYFTVAAALALATPAVADSSVPLYEISGGAGAVHAGDDGAGWLFRLEGSGHPWRKPWLLFGLEAGYFGRPEMLEKDDTFAVEGGTKQTRVHAAESGALAGLILSFPFGFGGDDATGSWTGNTRTRPVFDAGPFVSGGLHIRSRVERVTTIVNTGGEEKTTHRDPSEDTDVTGGYAQIGARLRWRFLEAAIAGQVLGGRPAQGAAWLGFRTPW